MKDVPYRSAIGSLMYAMVCTRPDICYAVGLVARFQSNPGLDHWQAVKRIMRYLKGTSHYALCYHGDGSSKIYGFSDADLAGDPDGSRSTSGFAFKLANGLISWRSKKQSCVATSTMEAVFVALSDAAKEAVWLKSLYDALLDSKDTTWSVMVYTNS